VFSGYYTKGIALTADGATVVVDTLVGAALATTEKATAFAQAAPQETRLSVRRVCPADGRMSRRVFLRITRRHHGDQR
jgi:hypothetical protein